MQLHTAQKVDKLLNHFLPHGYAETAKERLEKLKRNVSATYIRQVKSLHKIDLQILNTLIELAKENEAVAEAQKQKFEELTN